MAIEDAKFCSITESEKTSVVFCFLLGGCLQYCISFLLFVSGVIKRFLSTRHFMVAIPGNETFRFALLAN
jgi:hypothetical protein